jgi:hypothetical protein
MEPRFDRFAHLCTHGWHGGSKAKDEDQRQQADQGKSFRHCASNEQGSNWENDRTEPLRDPRRERGPGLIRQPSLQADPRIWGGDGTRCLLVQRTAHMVLHCRQGG